MESWDDDEHQKLDCFLPTVMSSNEYSNEALGVGEESSISFGKLPEDHPTIDPPSTVLNDENLGVIESHVLSEDLGYTASSSHDYLLDTNSDASGFDCISNRSNERRYQRTPKSSKRPASELIDELEGENLDKIQNSLIQSLDIAQKWLNLKIPKREPPPLPVETVMVEKVKKNSVVDEENGAEWAIEDHEPQSSSARAASRVVTSTPTEACSNSPMPVINTVKYVPTAEEKVVMRRHKVSGDCYVAVGSFEQAYTKELKRLEAERKKQERDERHVEKRKGGGDNDRDRKKKKKSKDSRKRSLSPSSRATSQSTTDASTSAAIALKKKKTFPSLTICVVCDEPINIMHSGLPIGAVYCSKSCISKQVKIAGQCLKSNEHVMLMDMNGMILNESRTPIVDALENFLLQYPNFRPVLNTTKLDKPDKKDYDEVANKKTESKRVDVRKVIEHHLQQRSKAARITYSSKRVKAISAEIEEELFRIHKSLSFKYRSWCKGFVNKIKDESNAFFRRVVTEKVSVKKLVTMTPEEMNSSISSSATNSKTSIISPRKESTSSVTPSIIDAANENRDNDENQAILNNIEMVDENENGEIIKSGQNSPTNPEVDAGVKLPTVRYSSLTSKYTMVKKKPLIVNEGKSAVDDILGNERDTTGQHNSHLYDANCAICQKKTKLDFAAKERAERMEAKFEAKKRIDNDDNRRKVPHFPNLTTSTKSSTFGDVEIYRTPLLDNLPLPTSVSRDGRGDERRFDSERLTTRKEQWSTSASFSEQDAGGAGSFANTSFTDCGRRDSFAAKHRTGMNDSWRRSETRDSSHRSESRDSSARHQQRDTSWRRREFDDPPQTPAERNSWTSASLRGGGGGFSDSTSEVRGRISRTSEPDDHMDDDLMMDDGLTSSPDNFARYLEETQAYAASSSFDTLGGREDSPPRTSLILNHSADYDRSFDGPPKKTARNYRMHEVSPHASPPPPTADDDLQENSLSEVNNLSDVLTAIQRLKKPAQIVLMVGHYINTHQVSEQESDIISRAIQVKSEAERLRNSSSKNAEAVSSPAESAISQASVDRRPTSVTNAEHQHSISRSSSRNEETSKDRPTSLILNTLSEKEGADTNATLTITPPPSTSTTAPVYPQQQHFDIVKLRRPPREVAEELRKKEAAAAESARPVSATSAQDGGIGGVVSDDDNDSTKAQQISFSGGDRRRDMVTPQKQPPPPFKPSANTGTIETEHPSSPSPPPPPPNASTSATTPPPPPPSSPPPPPPPSTSSGTGKKPALSIPVPVPVPPPAQSHFVYIFAPPPPPIPPTCHPPSSVAAGVNSSAILPNGEKNRGQGMESMDISDSEENNHDKNTSGGNGTASLLPPPPPPPSLPGSALGAVNHHNVPHRVNVENDQPPPQLQQHFGGRRPPLASHPLPHLSPSSSLSGVLPMTPERAGRGGLANGSLNPGGSRQFFNPPPFAATLLRAAQHIREKNLFPSPERIGGAVHSGQQQPPQQRFASGGNCEPLPETTNGGARQAMLQRLFGVGDEPNSYTSNSRRQQQQQQPPRQRVFTGGNCEPLAETSNGAAHPAMIQRLFGAGGANFYTSTHSRPQQPHQPSPQQRFGSGGNREPLPEPWNGGARRAMLPRPFGPPKY